MPSPENESHMNERVDLPEHVETRYNGMTQWDDPDSAMDSKVAAMTRTWKEDPFQQEPDDGTDGYGLTGITRAKGKDADEGPT